MHLAKKPALRRMWQIDQRLREKSYPTAEELAEQLEVNAKTVRRDLEVMQRDFHAPIRFSPEKNGWEYTCETYRLPAVMITEGELVAMFLAGQALQQAAGTPYEADLRRAIQKLKDFLPDEVSIHWQTLDQAQSFRTTVTVLHDVEIFRKVADAVIHHRRLSMRYWTASRDVESERLVDPYHLTCVDGTWYMVGRCHQRKETLTFAASRIRSVVETGDEFLPPATFQIGDHFQGAFKVLASNGAQPQSVRLKFAPSAAKFVREKIWHESQQCEIHADQSVTLSMTLRSLIEVKRWILSWGAECVVLDPQELKAQILDEVRKMLAESSSSQLPAFPSNATALEKIRDNLKQQPRRTRKSG